MNVVCTIAVLIQISLMARLKRCARPGWQPGPCLIIARVRVFLAA
ncbi:hypothetical protein WME75_34665 [Sorangium sp. So ce1014]